MNKTSPYEDAEAAKRAARIYYDGSPRRTGLVGKISRTFNSPQVPLKILASETKDLAYKTARNVSKNIPAKELTIIASIGAGTINFNPSNAYAQESPRVTQNYSHNISENEPRTFYQKLYFQVKTHEGFSSKTYVDTRGNKTIGYGTNLNTKKAREKIESLGLDFSKVLSGKKQITKKQASKLFSYDLENSIAASIEIFPNYSSFPESVRLVLPDMIYNLGKGKFKKFKKTIDAIKIGDYNTAAEEMKDSRWHNQVKSRAIYLENLMKSTSKESHKKAA